MFFFICSPFFSTFSCVCLCVWHACVLPVSMSVYARACCLCGCVLAACMIVRCVCFYFFYFWFFLLVSFTCNLSLLLFYFCCVPFGCLSVSSCECLLCCLPTCVRACACMCARAVCVYASVVGSVLPACTITHCVCFFFYILVVRPCSSCARARCIFILARDVLVVCSPCAHRVLIVCSSCARGHRVLVVCLLCACDHRVLVVFS